MLKITLILLKHRKKNVFVALKLDYFFKGVLYNLNINYIKQLILLLLIPNTVL